MMTLAGKDFREGPDHAIAVGLVHASARGQTKALVEETLADFAAVHFSPGEDGLEVHGLPDGAGFDVLGFKRETDLLARDTGDRRIDG